MNRKGDCWDNGVAESFLTTVEAEFFGALVPEKYDTTTCVVNSHINS